MTAINKTQNTFWVNQPIFNESKTMIFSRPIQEKLANQPVDFGSTYIVSKLDINNDQQLGEVIDFLNNNYYDKTIPMVKANETFNTKRYSLIFNKSLFKFITGNNSTTICVRLAYNNILVGVISGYPQRYQLKNKQQELIDTTILCVDKRLRSKSITSKLLTEFRNQFTDGNLKSGIFNSNRNIPNPLCKITTYQRPLTPDRLNEMGYFDIKDKSIIHKVIDKYTIIRKLPDNIKKATPSMFNKLHALYSEYMEKFDVHAIYTVDQLQTILQNEIVSTYVIYDKKVPTGNRTDADIIDFFSFYNYNTQYDMSSDANIIKSARLFIHTILSNDITTRRLTEYAAIAAHSELCNMFYITNTMELNEVLSDIDNHYSYDSDYYVNMYNWELPSMKPEQISRFVMVN